jgi:uncharacterized protein (PEP-CTERM system associated)
MGRAAERICRSVAAWSLAGWIAGLPVTAAANWIITPQVSDQETYTDNVLLTPTDRRSDLVTTLSPSILINGESARLRGSFNYSPTGYIYALTPKEDAVAQNLYADGTATLLPQHFFLDAHAYASLAPAVPGLATAGFGISPAQSAATFGGIGTGLSTAIPTSQMTQVTSVDASPYLVGHFGGFGTGELRYTVSNTSFGGPATKGFTPPGFSVQSTNTLINEGTAAFLTGDDFGPFASRLVLDAAEESGTGTLPASSTVAVDDSAYAINPHIFALASIGYENIRYSGAPPLHISDAIWGVGTRLTPRPNVSLTALYGHRNGTTAPYISLYYAVTARTTLTLTYSKGLTTTAQDIANTLAVSAATPTGQTIDTRTLLPTAIVNPVLGLQTGLFLTSQLTGTAALNLERNIFSLTAYRFSNALVARSTIGAGVSQKTTGGNGLWTHNLTPLTAANLGIGYSHSNYPGQPLFAEGLFTAGITVTHSLTRSLSGWAGYTYLLRTSPDPNLHLLSNVVFVGISKVF